MELFDFHPRSEDERDGQLGVESAEEVVDGRHIPNCRRFVQLP